MSSIFVRAGLLGHLASVALASNPIKVASSQYIAENQASTNDQYVLRDGGPQGSLNGQVVQTYADTLQCDNQDDYESGQNCRFVASNTIVTNTYVANLVTDFDTPQPGLFCGTDGTVNNIGNDRLQISAVLPIIGDGGVTWYVDLTQNGTGNCDGPINGCSNAVGVAAVHWNNGNPTCAAQAGFWDPNKEPIWGPTGGAIGPIKAADGNNYLYVMGKLGENCTGNQYNDVYLARVPQYSALNYNAYQYWNGSAFSSTRLTYPNFNGFSPAAVLGNIGAFGSWFYSAYYKQYVLLAVNTTNHADIIAYTAPQPQGPWSDPVVLYSNTSIGGIFEPLYSPQALVSYDNSGKSLTFVVSRFGRNSVSAVVKVNFA